MNLQIREFKQAIQEFVWKSELPEEVKRMVLAELYREAEEKATAALVQEIEERNRKEAEEREGKDGEVISKNNMAE